MVTLEKKKVNLSLASGGIVSLTVVSENKLIIMIFAKKQLIDVTMSYVIEASGSMETS